MIGRKVRRAALAIWLALTAPSVSEAATYDPDLTWRTIVTENFRIHFHQGEEQLAEEFSHMVEEVYVTMSAEMHWDLRMKVDVVLIDLTDRANGFATAVPYNAITIFVTAPQEDSTLSLYEDWSEAIFTHELTHVLHMETNRGIVSVARAVVGRIASTNDVSPWWMVEGLATLQETRQTSGGRGRSPFVHMIKRASVVDDAFPPLGNMDGLQALPPSGNLRYLFGQDFMQYVADHTGRDAWSRWVHTYGGHIPYLLPVKKSFGRHLQGLYYDWREEVFDRYGRQLRALEVEGIREGELLSIDDNSCSAPSFAPDDSRIVWSCSDPQTGSSIWSAEGDGSGAELLLKDFGAKTFTWRADSQAFVYAATHIVNRFNTWSDIYMFDMRSKSVRALTRGARARDPDFSPDGSKLVMVTNRVQTNQLEILTIDQQRRQLTQQTDHTQYSTPRWHPSGILLAFSVGEHGRRDLWLFGEEGERLRRLTHDAANDRDPMWTADGRYLFFSSDRSGIPNIYALEVETEHLWQVTNVRTGASRPSINPDTTRLVYEQYSSDGWEVRLLDLDPAEWLDRGLLPRPITGGAPLSQLVGEWEPPVGATAAWQGTELHAPQHGGPFGPWNSLGPHQDGGAIDTFEQTEVDDAFGEEGDYPFTIKPRRYNPWPSLIPRYWLPSLQITPRLPELPPTGPFAFLSTLPRPFNIPGLQVNASSGATDPLRHYGWSAFLTYRTDADFFGGGGSFTINRWLPVFSFGASTRAVPRTYLVVDEAATEAQSDGTLVYEDSPRTYFERRITASTTMSYPFSVRSTVFANYSFSERQRLSEIDPAADRETLALSGTLGTVSAGYRYSWSQQTAMSVSREDARILSLVGSFLAPWIGASATEEDGTHTPIYSVQFSAELREYVTMPWAANHVFAMRAAAGVSFANSRFLGNYILGGAVGDAAFYVRPAEYRMIRGYPFGADRGDNYWLAGGEYRFPLWRMDRGFGTVPAFLRVLHGAIYVDAGNAFNELTSVSDAFDDTLVGVGAELRLNTVLGWAGGFNFRLGYGVGLTQSAVAFGPASPGAFYFQLGGAY